MSELVYFIPAFHNGIPALLERNVAGGRVHVQAGHENDAYFSVPLHQFSRKDVRLLRSGNLCEFLCLCFSLDPASQIFKKLLKLLILVLRQINIRVIIYLNDMLSMGKTRETILKFRHNHMKRKDSLEIRVALSLILILTWNFGSGLSNSSSWVHQFLQNGKRR